MANRVSAPIQQVLTSAGALASGYKVFVYTSGTTTKQAIYPTASDADAATNALSNPITLNSRGEFSSNGTTPCAVYVPNSITSVKLVLTLSTDSDPPSSPVRTEDAVGLGIDTSGFQSGSATYAASAGTNTYTATLAPAISAYATGQKFLVKFGNANTAAATVNFNSLGAKSIVKGVSTALVAGDIQSSAIHELRYDGTNFVIDRVFEESEGAALTSAATVDLAAATGQFVHIAGSTGPITSLGTAPKAGIRRVVVFDSTPTLTHNASTLILTTGANITAAAGDVMVFVSEDAAGAWRQVGDLPANGIARASRTTVLNSNPSFTSTSASQANVTGAVFAVENAARYIFEFIGNYDIDVTTVGLAVTVTAPTGTVVAHVMIGGLAVDGVGTPWAGTINASGDVVTATSSVDANSHLFIVKGIFVAGAAGSLQLQAAVETVAGSPTLSIDYVFGTLTKVS